MTKIPHGDRIKIAGGHAHPLALFAGLVQRTAAPLHTARGESGSEGGLVRRRGNAGGKVATPHKSKASGAPSFAHLIQPRPAAADQHHAPVRRHPDGSARLACEIIAAAAKARTPTGTGAAKPTGLAAEILAAGAKARGEIRTAPPRPTGLAAEIIAAGEKRRGLTK